jgi:hypothetical protein
MKYNTSYSKRKVFRKLTKESGHRFQDYIRSTFNISKTNWNGGKA